MARPHGVSKKRPVARKAAIVPAAETQAATTDAIDAQLARYRSMRDFETTDEPSGSASTKERAKLPFVIQKHAATRLHYDFRLGWNHVLKSWAVTKGPSFVVRDRRLAVQVEDHPMEYGGFEGIIPKGQYGGGTVMLWDEGTWEPQPGHTDIDAGLKSGSLKFLLHGTKLKGKWTLVRMGGKAANEAKPNWLLIKEHDEFERSEGDPAIVDEAPNSVLTQRSLEQIAESQDHVWNSKDTAGDKAWHRNDKASTEHTGAPPPTRNKQRNPTDVTRQLRSKIAGASKENLPDFISPKLAMQALTPPTGGAWVHELKLDGYRIQARKDGAKVQLLTRTGLDWTHRMKSIAEAVSHLPCDKAVLDGEVVVVSEDGTTSFADLQAAFQEGAKKPLTYFLFDLLHLDGHNLRTLPLIERKSLLTALLQSGEASLRLSEHMESDGEEIFRKACELQAEGIVSKRSAGKYASGRASDWLKVKCRREQEFVIGGFTLPSKGHSAMHGIGALLLGYYQNNKLIYAGRTGTGFTQKTHRLLRDQLDNLRQTATAFEQLPPEARRGVVWVQPLLVAQVQFATWTAEKLLRQASFKGLREDKPAAEVFGEEPVVDAINSTGTGQEAAIKGQAGDPKKDPTKAGKTEELTRPAKAKAHKRIQEESAEHKSPAKKTVLRDNDHAPTREAQKGYASVPAPIRLTHPGKILDPKSSLTKQQLADYLWAIADHMLPHVAGRPLSLVRCPEGAEKPCFFQKHSTSMLPRGVESVDVPDKKSGKIEPYITLSTPDALASLAQIGVLEVHPWGSQNKDLEHPDRIIIDLDPDPAITWRILADSAEDIRYQLTTLGLTSFLKTTGGKGLHVVIPIQPKADWSVVKDFAHKFVLALEQQHPTLYLTKMSKAARKDRIYLDYLRNERGATAIAPFSPRARSGAPIALPLSWSDLKLPELPVFELTRFSEWKHRLSRDPWQKLMETRQSLVLPAA